MANGFRVDIVMSAEFLEKMEKYFAEEAKAREVAACRANKNAKLRWENGFQRWSDKMAKNGLTEYGKCGYSNICDFCKDNDKGRPCVRALNALCRKRKIKLDYTQKNYEEIRDL